MRTCIGTTVCLLFCSVLKDRHPPRNKPAEGVTTPAVVAVRRVDIGRIEVEVVRISSSRVGARRPELTVVAHVARVWSSSRASIKIEAPAAHEVIKTTK